MGRTKRFLSGVSFGYLSQSAVMLTGLWLTPFLLGRVGAHDYGLWLVALQVLAYFVLLDVGVVALLPRETAFATGRMARTGERGELPRLVGETARLVLWQTPLAALVALAVWLSLPGAWAELRWPLGLALLAYVLLFPLRVFQAVLQGLQDLAFVSKAMTAAWLAGLGVTIALIVGGFGLYALAAGWAATQALAVPVYWLRLRRSFPGVLPSGLPRLPWSGARRRLRSGLLVSTSQVAQALIFGTDLLVIGKLLGPAAVVPYACTAKLVAVLANQPNLLLQAAGPALSELKESESRERVRQVCAALGQAMLLASGAVACVVLAVNRGFVGWWVGEENYGGTLLTALVVLNILLRHWCLVVAAPLTSFGHDRHVAKVVITDGFLTAACTALCVWQFGIVGAPLGSIVGVVAVSLPYHLRALARETGATVRQTLAHLRPWAWRFALLAAACGAAGAGQVARGPAALALLGACVGAAYALVMLPIVRRGPLGFYAWPYVQAFAARLRTQKAVVSGSR